DITTALFTTQRNNKFLSQWPFMLEKNGNRIYGGERKLVGELGPFPAIWRRLSDKIIDVLNLDRRFYRDAIMAGNMFSFATYRQKERSAGYGAENLVLLEVRGESMPEILGNMNAWEGYVDSVLTRLNQPAEVQVQVEVKEEQPV